MNLNYSVKDIAKWVDAKIVGSDNGAINQIIIDSRSPLVSPHTLFVALPGSKTNGHDFVADFVNKGGRFAIVEHELNIPNLTQFIVEDSLSALQIIAKNHRLNFQIPIIGITGSNGKTIVKEWIYHILKSEFTICRSPKSYNSQIGVALSLLEINKTHELAIIEAGISRVGEMAKLEDMIKPTIGVFTGIGDAHQLGFKSIEEKEKEKKILFTNIDYLIDPNCYDSKISSLIPYQDKASILNASLSKEVAKYLKINDNLITKSLKKLPNISMRMEKMEGENQNIIINDTYTFDEKGLEIGLQSMSLNADSRPEILVLAPDLSYKFQTSLHQIIATSNIKTLVWIHPQPYPNKLSIGIINFNTVDDLIKNPFKCSHSILLFSGSRSMELERCIPIYQLKKHITQLEIHLDAIRHNINFFRKKISRNTQILAMVKAQSYGSGSVEMAKFLNQEKVDALGVAYADEGVSLRKEGITLPILVMNPEQAAFDDIIEYQLEPSIYSLKILDQFLNRLILKNKKRFPIQLKVDTGMHRLGFLPSEIKEVIATLNAQPEVYIKSVFSHLAVADDISKSEFTKDQINVFKDVANQIEKGIGYSFSKHIANSEGTLNYPESHFDMVRIGIGLFGLTETKYQDLKPALIFKTQISQIKNISPQESVGYGQRFIAKKTSQIGVIPVGYADGLSRALGNQKWQVKIGDHFAPIIGSICMDMCMIDITNLNCNEGDTVEIIGNQSSNDNVFNHSVQAMAHQLNTISYEIISSISSRVHRVYID